ncbi:MAG: acylneuraminate cytidylyltransferase [Erysipelotrichia bacterium]|nr:acylneuraminate cytidylyltransferase [Erysipelotrichia bacterium]
MLCCYFYPVMMVANQVIVQARMGSTRLPGKIMLPLLEKPVLEHVIARSSAALKVARVVVATTDLPEDDGVENWCRSYSVPCVRGSSEDVLARYVNVLREFPCKNIVRITADCPLTDPGIIDAMLCIHETMHNDYTSNVIPPTFPVGFDAEVIGSEVLRQVDQKAVLASHREHVTLYIRENLEEFKTANLSLGESFEHFRLTLDHDEDYQVLQKIFSYFRDSDGLFSLYQILGFIMKHPEIASINSAIDRFEGAKKSAAMEHRKLKWE